MNHRTPTTALAWALVCAAWAGSASLESGFLQPPDSTKPWCYWYWISDNISKEGITRDLEAMARVGIGEALIGNIHLEDIPAGKVKVLSEEWWRLVEHAIREGARVGVNIGLFNCPGWSQSGGPWIKPQQAMRYLVSSEMRVTGPAKFEQKLPTPKEPFQGVAVLAFPAPLHDADSLRTRSPRLVCAPAATDGDVARLIDGNPDTALALKGDTTLEIELAQPLTARSLRLTPGEAGWSARGELWAAGDDGAFRSVKSFKLDRSNMAANVGPMPRGPVSVSFPATTARRFRLVLTGVSGKAALAELDLSPAARVESVVEKQLGKMHPTPLPMWDTYLWPPPVEPEDARLCIPPDGVMDLSSRLAPDGTLRWDVPAGQWVIIRTGMAPTGTRNAPASPEGQGLEVDKMNRQAAKVHFDAFIGRLLARMPASERRAFKHVVADSYEMGSQNWTDGFAITFRQRYGYDPMPWLPVLTGRIVGSADQSDRFLWDLRRLVADHIAKDYVGGLRDLCRPHGLELWLENYGHWGFPAEFLQYGGQSDRVAGEFWAVGELGSIECRAASSCANTYGKPIVSVEAFTSSESPFQRAPAALKARGDWAFCEGMNHFILHVYIHQPWPDRLPGMNAWFGTEFNRHNTWFEAGRAWVDYLRRCSFLLQQGWRVADVAYFIGEDAPKMTGLRQPELPPGRDFDYINAEVILDKLGVQDGWLTLPHGASYRVLVLPQRASMRPAVLRKIRDLVQAGATVVGSPPARSPSLENFPKCDEEARALATELWQTNGRDGETQRRGDGGSTVRRFGKGRVIQTRNLAEMFERDGLPPDFQSAVPLRFTHRRDGATDIYFVANPRAQEITTVAAFRVSGKAPELWWPDSGHWERPAVFEETAGVVRLPISLGAHGSVFVVFREKSAGLRSVVAVNRDGQPLLDARWTGPRGSAEGADARTVVNDFTLAVWVKPTADTTLVPETNQGVSGLREPRNDVIFPPHGNTLSPEPRHAGSGLAVGRNGVVVFEHGADHFAPVLVHSVVLTDWTHLAVVHRNGQPHLFVNGALAHRGLKSRFTVHPGTGGGGTPFRGESGAVEHVPRALSDDEVAALAKTMPRPAGLAGARAVRLARSDDGRLEATVWQPGRYEVRFADGRTRNFEVTTRDPALELAGPWEVNFTPGWGAPEKVTFQKLEDWTRHPDDGIKFYSGRAVYRTTFEWNGLSAMPRGPGGLQPRAGGVVLDLGRVHDLATVRLNGQTLRTLWLGPWQVDITEAVRAGRNELEIEVVNVWNNRLVGDRALPPEQRRTFLARDTVPKNAPLLPAGLLGPVRIQAAEEIEISPP